MVAITKYTTFSFENDSDDILEKAEEYLFVFYDAKILISAHAGNIIDTGHISFVDDEIIEMTLNEWEENGARWVKKGGKWQ